MATQVKLTAERRTAVGRSAVRKIKASGAIPAVVYGAKAKPELLQVSKRDMSALLSHSAGENILVELEIAGESGKRLVSRSCRKCSMRRSVGIFSTSISTRSRWTK